MGVVAVVLFIHGDDIMMKLLVAPESIIADDDDGGDRDGGIEFDSKISAVFILSFISTSSLAPNSQD